MKLLIPLVIVSCGCLVYLASTADLSRFGSAGGGLEMAAESAGPTDSGGHSDLQQGFGAGESRPGNRLTNNQPRLVLMKFGAPWCPPCRMVDQELRKLKKSSLPVEIRKIDVDEQPALADRYGVSSIPRLILLQDGRKVGDLVGYRSSEQLTEWITTEASQAALAAKKSTAMPSVVHSNPFVQ